MGTAESNKKVREGIVVSDRMAKTRSVEVMRQFRHPLYEKVMRRRKHYFAHDEKNESKAGDRVLIRETRPLSRNKCWEIIKILNEK